MATALTIKVTTTSRLRSTGDRWKETTALNETFAVETTVDDYTVDLEPMLAELWTQVTYDRLRNAEVGAQYSVTIANDGAPTPAAGSIVQAKRHLNGTMAWDEWDDLSDLRDVLTNRVTLLADSI